jgi:hypothetical protein
MKAILGILAGILLIILLPLFVLWRIAVSDSEYFSDLSLFEQISNRCIKYNFFILTFYKEKLINKIQPNDCEQAVNWLQSIKSATESDLQTLKTLLRKSEFYHLSDGVIFSAEIKRSGRKFHLDSRVNYRRSKRNPDYTEYPQGFYVPKK